MSSIAKFDGSKAIRGAFLWFSRNLVDQMKAWLNTASLAILYGPSKMESSVYRIQKNH